MKSTKGSLLFAEIIWFRHDSELLLSIRVHIITFINDNINDRQHDQSPGMKLSWKELRFILMLYGSNGVIHIHMYLYAATRMREDLSLF